MAMVDSITTPLSWVRETLQALQWPVVVGLAFGAGRYAKGLESRVDLAEKRVEVLVERHMPAVHRALAEIRGLLLSRR